MAGTEASTRSVAEAIIRELRALSSPANVAGMARFGINPDRALGISIPTLRRMARGHRRDHELARELWATGIHEARILASLVDDPTRVTREQAEDWVREFNSWDLCDGVCGNLLDKTPFALSLVHEWSGRSEEFVKRAAFALIAYLAVHDRKLPDGTFLELLEVVDGGADDDRNYVKKAVNWALRQIGKRNRALNAAAVSTAEVIRARGSRPGKWIAADALRELMSPTVQQRLV